MAFLKGILLGLGLVMPLGPLNLYIFNNASLQKRYAAALPVILMSALCDLSLILFAVLGVDIISRIDWFVIFMMSVGSVFLFYMGIKMWVGAKKTVLEPAMATTQSIPSQLASSAMLSILNPHAILDTFIVIGAVSATFVGFEKWTFTMGCMFSDFAWFLFLGTAGYFLRKLSHGPKIFFVINRFSSLVMIGLALQLVISLVKML
ncbi:MAG: LysE family transporter [Chlamydiota bacterium]